jgi:hypothetical protein
VVSAPESRIAAQIYVMTHRDGRSEAALLPAKQAVPVDPHRAAERERGDHDTGQRGAHPGPPVGAADDRHDERGRGGQKARGVPAHLVDERGVLLDVNGGLAPEREGAERVRCGGDRLSAREGG